ncbi:MAG: recombination mediator RecR [Dehalococcoidia bacterium]
MVQRSSVTVAEPVARLIDEFSGLPGIGPKMAQRLTYYLLRMPEAHARDLAEAIIEVKEKIVYCSVCFNITVTNPCPICSDDLRDPREICVVEEPLDVLAIERTHEFRGRYHVLHGALNPLDGIGPDHLKIDELLRRVREEKLEEVILATNPNQLGNATAAYLQHVLQPLNVRLSRPAQGLSMGSDIQYADEVTLGKAFSGRQSLT